MLIRVQYKEPETDGRTGFQSHGAVPEKKTKQNVKEKTNYDIQDTETFMWKTNRTRQPEKVDLSSLDAKDCGLFPNVKYGLNERKLIVGLKIFLKLFLHTEISPETGEVEFQGVLMDILKYSSQFSNYTYVLIDEANGFVLRDISWNKYADLLDSGAFDIGLSVWATQFKISYNLSFSYPVAFDAMVGIYRRPGEKDFANSWVFVSPFPPFSYLFLLGCLLYISFLYVLISGYWHGYPSKELERDIDQRHVKHSKDQNKWKCEKQGAKMKKVGINIYCIFLYYTRTIFSFLTAVLNQSYLPRPYQMSSRIIVGVWAIGIVFFYATFSSSITAKMVTPNRNVPFSTIKNFLKRNDYSATLLKETILDYSLRGAKRGSQLAAMGRKTTTIEYSGDGNTAVDSNLPNYLNNLKPNVVFFHYKSAIDTWLRSQKNAEDYILMDKDPVFNSDISIVFPEHSEFQEMMSHAIRRLYECGIQTNLVKTHNDLLKGKSRKRRLAAGDSHRAIKIHHLFWIGMICLMCLLLSLIVLALENLRTRWPDIAFALRTFLPNK